MQHEISLLSLFCLIALSGCSGPEAGLAPRPAERSNIQYLAEPATEPARAESDEGPPEAQHLQRNGFGTEDHRVVDEKDEITSVLQNGVTVIVRRVQSPAVSVRGYAATGGVYEGKWLGGGLSHLLEHLVAGGSNERRTEAQNRDLLQQIGNDSNAYTSEDHTAFFVNTTSEHMEKAVDLITGWMLGAKITPAEYRREYEVVQRELEMDKGEPDRIFQALGATNRYRVSPAGIPVIGYQPVIQSLSRDDVYSYYRQAYVPNNLLFVVTGNLPPEQMLAAVRKHVDDVPPGRVFSHNIAPEPQVTAPRSVVATFPKLGEAKLLLAFPGVQMDNPDMYALDLLAEVLGSGDSSLLVEELRDRQGLVTDIGTGDDTPSYATGSFEVMMDLDAEKITQATAAVLNLLEKVKSEGIDAERLARAKTLMRADRIKRMQTAEDIGESLALDYLGTGNPHFSDRYLTRMDSVTAEQVQAAARKYLDPGVLLTTALVPAEWAGAKGLPRAEDLIRKVAPPTSQPIAATQAAPGVERVELDDGTILLLKRITTSPLVVIDMYALGGVTAEDEKTNGLGNLAMEMLVRGTKTRSAEEIAEFFDSIGGEVATASGNNTWAWSATCMKEDFAKAFEAWADVVNNPAFPDDELTAVKRRTIAAIDRQDAEWTGQAMRFFKESYFGPAHSPYRFTAAGTAVNVKNFTRDQVHDWYFQHVLASPRVVSVFGDIDPATVKSLAGKLLASRDRQRAPVAQRPRLESAATALPEGPPSVNVLDVKVNHTEQALAGIVVGYRAEPYIGDPEEYPLDVTQTITGGWSYPTGYLFETLRGRGLVYEVASQNSPGRDKALPGTFLVLAGCDPKNVNEVVDLILENMARPQGTEADINPSWFARAKELMGVADALEHETPKAQAMTAALDELFGMGYSYHDEFVPGVRAVHIAQVQSVSRRRLRECVVTVCTPDPASVAIKPGLRRYESFPPVELTPRGIRHDTGGGASK